MGEAGSSCSDLRCRLVTVCLTIWESSVTFFLRTSLTGIADSLRFLSFGLGALYDPCRGNKILPSDERTEGVGFEAGDLVPDDQAGELQAEVLNASRQEDEVVESTVDHLSGVLDACSLVEAVDDQLPRAAVLLVSQRTAGCPRRTGPG